MTRVVIKLAVGGWPANIILVDLFEEEKKTPCAEALHCQPYARNENKEDHHPDDVPHPAAAAANNYC